MELEALIEQSRRHVAIIGRFTPHDSDDLTAVTPGEALEKMRYELVATRVEQKVNADDTFWTYQVRMPAENRENGLAENETPIDTSQGPLGEYLGDPAVPTAELGARVLADLLDALEDEAILRHGNLAVQLTEALYHCLQGGSRSDPGEERHADTFARRIVYEPGANRAILSWLLASKSWIDRNEDPKRRLEDACRSAFEREGKIRAHEAGGELAELVVGLRDWLDCAPMSQDAAARFDVLESRPGASAAQKERNRTFEGTRARHPVPRHTDASIREIYSLYRRCRDRIEAITGCEPVMALVTDWYLSTFKTTPEEDGQVVAERIYDNLYRPRVVHGVGSLPENALEEAARAHAEAHRAAQTTGGHEAQYLLETSLREHAVGARRAQRTPPRGVSFADIDSRADEVMKRTLARMIPGRDRVEHQISRIGSLFREAEAKVEEAFEKVAGADDVQPLLLKELDPVSEMLATGLVTELGKQRAEAVCSGLREARNPNEPQQDALAIAIDWLKGLGQAQAAAEQDVIRELIQNEGAEMDRALRRALDARSRIKNDREHPAGVLPAIDPEKAAPHTSAMLLGSTPVGEPVAMLTHEEVEQVRPALEQIGPGKGALAIRGEGDAPHALVIDRDLSEDERTELAKLAQGSDEGAELVKVIDEAIKREHSAQQLTEHRSMLATRVHEWREDGDLQIADTVAGVLVDYLGDASRNGELPPQASMNALVLMEAVPRLVAELPRGTRTRTLVGWRQSNGPERLRKAVCAIPIWNAVPSTLRPAPGQPAMRFRELEKKTTTDAISSFMREVQTQTENLTTIATFNQERKQIRMLLQSLAKVPGTRVTVVNETLDGYPGTESMPSGIGPLVATPVTPGGGSITSAPGTIYISSQACAPGKASDTGAIVKALGLRDGDNDEAPFCTSTEGEVSMLRVGTMGGLVSIPVIVGFGIADDAAGPLPVIDLPTPGMAALVAVATGLAADDAERVVPGWMDPIGDEAARALRERGMRWATRHTALRDAMRGLMSRPETIEAFLAGSVATGSCLVRQLGPLEGNKLAGTADLSPDKKDVKIDQVLTACVNVMERIWDRAGVDGVLDRTVCSKRPQDEQWELIDRRRTIGVVHADGIGIVQRRSDVATARQCRGLAEIANRI